MTWVRFGPHKLLRLTEPRHSFGIVLLTIAIAVVFQLASPDGTLARLIGIVIQAAVVVIALRAAGAQKKVMITAAVTMVIVAVSSTFVLLGFENVGSAPPRIVTLLLILLAPAAVVGGLIRELREDRTVTLQTVYCGLCIYLLIGMAFAFIYGVLDAVGPNFFNNGEAGTPNDFLYFSLATLTTTGYGDFTAATELGRTFSVTEALFGQIYLVTVVAVTVSNLRGTHRGASRR